MLSTNLLQLLYTVVCQVRGEPREGQGIENSVVNRDKETYDNKYVTKHHVHTLLSNFIVKLGLGEHVALYRVSSSLRTLCFLTTGPRHAASNMRMFLSVFRDLDISIKVRTARGK